MVIDGRKRKQGKGQVAREGPNEEGLFNQRPECGEGVGEPNPRPQEPGSGNSIC